MSNLQYKFTTDKERESEYQKRIKAGDISGIVELEEELQYLDYRRRGYMLVITGLVEIAELFPEKQQEVMDMLNQCSNDKSNKVKAAYANLIISSMEQFVLNKK